MSEPTITIHSKATGTAMYELVSELYPICRSITGDGVRDSLKIISRYLPLEVHEVPSGTQVFDWKVPKEWNIYDAYVKNERGEKVIDFRQSNLHILNYSLPVNQRMPLAVLKEHLYTIPEQPDWIPYRTSYYKENWGFCLSQQVYEKLEDGEYEVVIDSSLENGSLTYGEYFLPGQTEDEILISCHCCHPSLCNDNLSGMALATFLAASLGDQPRRYSYRFLFIPGTIGAITWLALHEEQAVRIKHGLVVACVGDAGGFTYKRSRRGNAEIDRIVEYVLQKSSKAYTCVDFSPYGYDERQYCSPGFNLAVGRLTRTPNGSYPEYHTSADNLELVRPDCLADSLNIYRAILDTLEENRFYINTNPKCEPQLGRRGLLNGLGGQKDAGTFQMGLLWLLSLSDGEHSLFDVALKADLDFQIIKDAAQALHQSGLLKEIQEENQ